MSAHTHELCLCTYTQKVAVWNVDTWQPGQEIDQAAPADDRDYSSHSSSEEEYLSFFFFLFFDNPFLYLTSIKPPQPTIKIRPTLPEEKLL